MSLYYCHLGGKIEEYDGKKYLIVNDSVSNEVLDKIRKIIGIGKFDNTKILIEKDDKLPNDVTLKVVIILITCVIKDDTKCYPQVFLEEALYDE